MKRNQLKDLESLKLFDIKISDFNGRELIDTDGNKLIDFCNTGYLGFEYEKDVHEKGVEYSKKWGSISGWSRMEVDPHIYGDFENNLKNFLKCEDVVLSQTVTITNFSIMPFLAKKGVIFTDSIVHTVVWESCRLARDHGSKIVKFEHQNLNSLEDMLKENKHISPKIIAVDGVYSISSEYAPVKELNDLAKKYDAYIYIDDAHGFGVLGDSKNADNPYGNGNGVARYFECDYDRILYVSSFGKAFGSSIAFITIPEYFRSDFRSNFTQYLFSAPPCPYQIGCVEAGLELNQKIGNERRMKIYRLTNLLCTSLARMGIEFYNNDNFPVVFVKLGSFDNLFRCASLFRAKGIIPGFRAYPVVPADECGMRFAITATHSEEDILSVLDLFSEYLSNSFETIQKVHI